MASQINPYLCFNGNCEEAFNYYKTIFGGEFTTVHRFKDMPPNAGMKIEEKDANKIMNITLPINGGNILYGSDGNPNYPAVPFGKNISLTLEVDSKENADRCFKMLSEGGKITMPIQDMFWGAYFGMCDDKFGMNWMVSFRKP
jgi:PhnB protein